MAPMTRQFSPNRTPTEDVARYYQRRAEGVGSSSPRAQPFVISPQRQRRHPRHQRRGARSGLGQGRRGRRCGQHLPADLAHGRDARRPGLRAIEVGPWPLGLLPPGKAEAGQDRRGGGFHRGLRRGRRNAKAAGFDGVELHGAHGYLIDQFFWEGTNTRTDQYGGDMVARTRYACEIIRAVRAAVGPDYPIMLRYSQWKQQDFESKLAPTPEALEAFLAPLTDAGLDAYHCSTRRYWEPESSAMNLAGWTKKLTGLATVTVGSVGLNQDFVTGYASEDMVGTADIDGLAERVEAGEFDVVAVGRALIATPNWPRLVAAGQLEEAATYSRAQLAELV